MITEEEDYFGSAVVMGTRIMYESKSGQILVFDLLRQVAEGPSNTQNKCSDFGCRTLKGFEDEEQIYEVLWQAAT